MMKEITTNKEQLDQEWIDLILEAMEMGMSVEDVQTFLQSKSA